MPTIYSSLYTNFIRQGSTFAKSITTHGYAQSVVAAAHPHVLNAQNRPVFGRRHTNRLGRLSNFQLHSAFHSERTGAGLSSDHRHGHVHGGLDAYFEALQKQQAAGEADNEWTQFEFQKRIEWKPSSSTVLAGEEGALAAEDPAVEAVEDESSSSFSVEEAAALAHINAALEKEIESRQLQEAAENAPWASVPVSRSQTPRSVARTATPPIDSQSQSYADHLAKLAAADRYAEIPAVFEAMLATGVKPIASAYNALLLAAIHIPTKKIEIVSKALDVYADMIRRRVTPDSETYDILVNLLASRSLEVSAMKKALGDKRQRFGGMDEPGKFMFASHELEHAILCEDDRLDLAIKLFDQSADADTAMYSAETYHELIIACAEAGRVSDMLRLFEHMEFSKTAPIAAIFPAMITAFASRGDLVSAVECYNEYRSLAVAHDNGSASLHDRLDDQVYAAVINAYVVSDKIEGAMKFFQKIVSEYGVRAVDIKDALVSLGFVKGFISRGIYQEAFHWAQSIEAEAQSKAMARLATVAADNSEKMTAIDAYGSIKGDTQAIVTPTMALLAMSIREGDVASATKYWHALSRPEIHATASFIEQTAMYAVALIGS